MKTLYITTLLSLLGNFAMGQSWKAIDPPATVSSSSTINQYQVDDAGNVFAIYQYSNAGTPKLVVDKYEPLNQVWTNVLTHTLTSAIDKIHVDKVNGVIYFAFVAEQAPTPVFKVYKIENTVASLVLIDYVPDYEQSTEYEFAVGSGTNEFYWMYQNNDAVNINVGKWNQSTLDIEGFALPEYFNINATGLQMAMVGDTLWFSAGQSSTDARVIKAHKNTLATQTWDGSAQGLFTVGGGNNILPENVLLHSNKTDRLTLHCEDYSNNIYEFTYDPSVGVFNPASTTGDYYGYPTVMAMTNGANKIQIFANFDQDIPGSTQQLKVIEKDYGTDTWDIVGNAADEIFATDIVYYNRVRLGYSDNALRYVAAWDSAAAIVPKVRVMNTPPNTASTIMTLENTFCVGTTMSLATEFSMEDDNYDRLKIVGVTSSDITVADPVNFTFADAGQTGMRQYFYVTFKADAVGSTDLTFSITDGYDTIPYTYTINVGTYDLASYTDGQVCGSGTVDLNASVGSGTLYWFNVPGGGTSLGSGAIFTTPSLAADAVYYVEGKDNNCFTPRYAVNAFVRTLPTVSAGADQAVCNDGTNITLTGSGAVSYTWDNGVTDGVAFNQAVGTVTYTVTGTDGNGCQNTDQADVTVHPLPTVDAGAHFAVCDGTPITLSGSGAASYAWDNSVTDGVSFTINNTTVFTVTGTDANGCINTDQIFVTVHALPNVTAGSDQQVCTGSSVTLNASGATTYSWDNGVTDGVSFTPAATLTYTVTGTDGNGCQNTDQLIVTVDNLPAVNAGTDQTVCSGDMVTLSGSGASSYAWDNGVFDGAAFAAGSTTTYTVTGTDGNGCVNTDQVVVTVNSLPTVNAGTDQTVCDGTPVTLSGSGATSYSWDNSVTDGAAFTPASTLTYTVTGTDANGCVNTDQVDVFVNPLPTVDAGSDVDVCNGNSVTLTGGGANTYAWDNGVSDGVAFTPASTLTYTVTGTDLNGCSNTDQVVVTVNNLPTVNAGTDQTVCTGDPVTLSGSGANAYAWDNGVLDGQSFGATTTTTYTVTGTDANGCINTDQVLVTVNSLPTVNAGADQTVCPSTSVTLSGSGASSYAWDHGVTDGVAFTPGSTLTYTVTGTDANGCQNTDQVDVIISGLPAIVAGANQTVCEGDLVTLSASGGVSYTWDNGVTDGVPFNATVSKVYTVTGTDANGCQNTDQVFVIVNTLPVVDAGTDFGVCNDGSTVTLFGAGASSYVWDNGVTDGVAFTPGATLTYTVTGTDLNGCTDTDQITVTLNSLPTVGAGADQTVCDGTSITLSGSGASSYAWDNFISDGVAFVINSTTTYTVTGTDANGCVNTDQVTITVNALPNVNAGADQTVCDGTAVTLSGAGAVSYAWDNGVTDGVAFTPVTSGTYTVTGTDANGCQNTDQVDIYVNSLPVVDAGSDQTICNGTPVTLAGMGANTYVWDNGITDGVAFTPASTLTYTVTGTDGSGCVNTDQVTITVNPLPTVNAGVDQTVCDGASVTLGGAGASSYTWDNFITDSVAFVINSTTTFTVTGTDANGCVNTDQVTVTVNALPVVNAGADQTVCDGTPVTLSGSGATSYSWDNGVADGVAFTPSATNTYIVTGTDANGCVNTDQLDVYVNGLPVVDAGTDQTVCDGTPVTLSGSGAASYSWDNGITDGVAFTPASTLTYTVTGTDGNGCSNTDQITVTVNALPTVDAGLDQTVCDGASVTLGGAGASSYTWDNAVADSVAFVINSTTTFTVTGTNANGCQNTDQVTVTVNPLPLVDAGTDQTVCDGTPVTLSGSGAASYNWDNSVSDGVAFTPNATTIYTVIGTDANGCQNTDVVTVIVNSLPGVDGGPDQAVCAGNQATLTASGANTYVWDNGITDGVAFTPASTLTYTVTGTDANGCVNTDQVLVSVNALPTVDAGFDFAVCDGASATLFANGAMTYTWDNGVTDGLAFVPTATTTYTVIGTDANGCQNTDAVVVSVTALPSLTTTPSMSICSEDFVTLNAASTAPIILWFDQATGGVEIATGNTFTTPVLTSSTTYYAEAFENGCSSNRSAITISINGKPQIAIASTTSECGNNNGSANAIIAGGTAPYAYYWSSGQQQTLNISGLAPGSYYFNVEDANGCKAIGVTEVQPASLSFVPTITNPSCNQSADGAIALNITGFSGPLTYLWNTGKSTQGISGLKAGTYEVTVSNDAGCVVTESFVLTEPAPIAVTWNNVLPSCGINDGQLAINTTTGGTAPYFFSWSNGRTGQINPNVTYGAYTVTVNDNAGCQYSETIFLSEKDAPLIEGSVIEPACLNSNGSINLDITPVVGDAMQSVSWSNGATTEDITNLGAGNYVSFVTTQKNCVGVNGWKLNYRKPDVQELCLVTVDSVTTTNLVVWEKPVTSIISHYNIYRESNQIDDYQLIDTVNYTNLSVFNDVVASPVVRAWRYKISAVDVCGSESDLSAHHKTLHLNTFDLGASGVKIVWDKYEGTAYSSYVLYRYTDAFDGWENIASLPTSVQSFDDVTLISEPGLDYMVEIVLNDTCTATNWRAQDFNTSRSNKEKGVFKPGSGVGEFSNNELVEFAAGEIKLAVYPNPFENDLILFMEGTDAVAVQLTDVRGKLILNEKFGSGQSHIDVSGLSAGIYFVRANINGQEKTIKIIKE